MRIFRHTGGFWCSCGKQVRSREIRKGWRDLRWICWLLSSAVIFENVTKSRLPEKIYFSGEASALTKHRHPS